jgi:hypothetical protein
MGRPNSAADHLVADFHIHIPLDQREEGPQVAGMSAVVQEVADRAGEGVEHIPAEGTAVELVFDVVRAHSSVKIVFGLLEGTPVEKDTSQDYNLPAVAGYVSGQRSKGPALIVVGGGRKIHFGEERKQDEPIEVVLAVVAARLQLGIGQ